MYFASGMGAFFFLSEKIIYLSFQPLAEFFICCVISSVDNFIFHFTLNFADSELKVQHMEECHSGEEESRCLRISFTVSSDNTETSQLLCTCHSSHPFFVKGKGKWYNHWNKSSSKRPDKGGIILLICTGKGLCGLRLKLFSQIWFAIFLLVLCYLYTHINIVIWLCRLVLQTPHSNRKAVWVTLLWFRSWWYLFDTTAPRSRLYYGATQ
mgnify:CR=1 FL=1